MKYPLTSLLILACLGSSAYASVTVYSGWDAAANSTDPRPTANAAASNFDSAIGAHSVVTFESAPLGAYASLNVALGVTLTGVDAFFGNQLIINTPWSFPDNVYGYNTTAGGSKFANITGGTLTFTFANPTYFFGGYFTGLQVADSVNFNDGAAQSLALPNNPSGGVAFLGFLDSNPFTSVTVNGLNDVMAVDDVRVVGSVPEPASLVAVAVSALALRKRRVAGRP